MNSSADWGCIPNTFVDPKRSVPSWFGSILEAKLPAPPVCGFLSPRQKWTKPLHALGKKHLPTK